MKWERHRDRERLFQRRPYPQCKPSWCRVPQSPIWPVGYARRVLQHNRYTQSLSDAPVKTPLYDYNQIMYALSLDDPRMALPTARYRVKGQSAPLSREEIEKRALWDDVEAVDHYIYNGARLPNPDPRLTIDRRSKPVLR